MVLYLKSSDMANTTPNTKNFHEYHAADKVIDNRKQLGMANFRDTDAYDECKQNDTNLVHEIQ